MVDFDLVVVVVVWGRRVRPASSLALGAPETDGGAPCRKLNVCFACDSVKIGVNHMFVERDTCRDDACGRMMGR